MPTTMPTVAGLASWLPLLALVAAAMLGLAMLLLGRVVHRAVLGLVGAAAGLVLGGGLAKQLNFHPLLGGAVLAIALGILGVVLARVFWAVVAAALAASLVAGATYGEQMRTELEKHPALAASADRGAVQAVRDAGQAVQAAGESAWQKRSTTALASAAAAALAAMAVGWFLPRATVVVLTSLIGAALTCAAVGAAVVFHFGLSLQQHPVAVAVCFGVLLLLGLVAQVFGEVRSRGKGEEPDEETPAEMKKTAPEAK